MRAREACATAMMTAACLAASYALVGVPNVTLMDFLVFASGLLFGPRVGVSVAVLTWAIYGTLNPYGFCLPVFIATSASEPIYGLGGRGGDEHGQAEAVGVEGAVDSPGQHGHGHAHLGAEEEAGGED